MDKTNYQIKVKGKVYVKTDSFEQWRSRVARFFMKCTYFYGRTHFKYYKICNNAMMTAHATAIEQQKKIGKLFDKFLDVM